MTKDSTAIFGLRPLILHEDGSVDQYFTEAERRSFKGWQPVTKPRKLDEEESERVGHRIGALPRQCWFNARKVVLKLGEYAESSYVEGIAVLAGWLPTEHGWVCRPDGTIIDPTLPRGCMAYFPGLEFVGRAGIEGFLATAAGRKCRRSPFLYAFGWGGGESSTFSKAWKEAMAYQARHIQPRGRIALRSLG